MQWGKDSIFVVVNWFSQMVHFAACNKTKDVTNITKLYFEEVAGLHGIPQSIVLYQDTKFFSHFWITLWKKSGAKLKYSTTCHS